MPSRFEVIQALLNLFKSPTYLEIGVNRGTTFHALTASRKVAVDPKFLFSSPNESESINYFEVTSDEYFGRFVSDDISFDVVFLDGLHTFEQTLRDLINILRFVHTHSIIVIDDVIPNSYHASLPDGRTSVAVRTHLAASQADPSWMGDVYKLVFFVDTFFQQYSYATTADNHGQLIMWPSRRNENDLKRRSLDEISKLDFSDTIVNRSVFNLQNFSTIRLDIERFISSVEA